MSNKLQETLARLAKLNAQNGKQGNGGSVKYFSPKKGKNNLLFLATEETGDPFLVWGEHKGLLDKDWKTIPCKAHNKGEECLVCSIIKDLQKQDWKGNFNIWKPIEQKKRYFSPVVDLDDLSAGLQWWGYGKSVLGQLENWLLNLEEGETPFYDLENPEKVVVSYDPDADPSLKYKLDKKTLKEIPSEVEKAIKEIKPLVEVITFEKTDEQLAELLESYMAKIQSELEQTDDDETQTDETQTDETQSEGKKPQIGKLSGLKKNQK